MNRHEALGVGGTAALALALYLPGLGIEVLRHPLEAKYALVAREMLEGGPWLVPHVFGELFPDKPPLYFWATATLGWIRGGRIDEVTARLPAALAALAGVLLVARLGRDLFSLRAGLLAGLALATSNLFFWYARQGHLDQFLTAFVTLAGLGLWRALTATDARRATGWTVLAYAAMGLGVLSKGLIGLVVPLLAAAGYLAATGPVRAIPARLHLGTGLSVFLAVVLAWFGPAVVWYGPGYFYETVVHQHMVRYTRTWAHAGSWYYYFGEFPVGFFPWALFLPSAMVLAWRVRAESGASPPWVSPALFPLSWLVTGFVFFSLASGKRGPYILPIYPAAALLVGYLWDRALDGRVPTRWVGVPVRLIAGAAVLLALGLLIVPRRLIPGRMVHTLVPADPRQLAAVIGLLLVGAVAVWGLCRAGRAAGTFAVLVALQAVFLLTVATVRASQYETEFPVRDFAARVRAAVPPGQPVFSVFEDYNNIIAFYLDRPLRPLAGPDQLAAARPAGAPVYVLVRGGQPSPDGQPGAPVAVAVAVFERRPLAVVRIDPPRR